MLLWLIISHIIIYSLSLRLNTMKVAVVTGANKGIGLEIAKKIGASGYKTILACRSESLGREAEQTLKGLGYDVEFRQLDVGDPSGFSTFAANLDRDYGKVDVLVNNAAIAFKNEDPTPFAGQARPTLKINFFGTVQFTELMLPLLRKSPSPRLVNVASMAGHLRIVKTESIKTKFASADSTLSMGELNAMIEKFQTDVESGTHAQEGWPNTCYGMSKLALIAATKILARQEPSILINACCPGYCDTDMSSHKGPRSAEHGARTPALLALSLPDGGPTGQFYSDEQPVEW